MKINSLQISNVLSFKHYSDVANAEKITFEDGINIIIGENGAGKSTALEVINFLFKRVLYKQYDLNQDLYSRRSTITAQQRKDILRPTNNDNFGGFRLEPNWNSENEPQTIRTELKLDAIDLENINNITNNLSKLTTSINYYTNRVMTGNSGTENVYILDVKLDKNTQNFSLNLSTGANDFGFEYLCDYNFYREAIRIHNLENPTDSIEPLYESFTLISSYRNYHAFNKSVSLSSQHPSHQKQNIKNLEFSKSLNTGDNSEPSIFGLVRLRVAELHQSLITQKLDLAECDAEANKLPFIISINSKIKKANLECKIVLLDSLTWQYSFEFFDTRRKKVIEDINSLSAGQKAIVHLVFEAYGRGDLKGGVVIIDEPEIHLHYQFQHEYLQVIRELNKEQQCQYILVTHSEALINSSTISQVKRFSLGVNGSTQVKAPKLSTDQRMLIKMLDNTRSTYAFFAKKVILVEGEDDRYLYKAIIQEKYPELEQEIAVLHMGGKSGYDEWSKLFKSFGLSVYCIGDFDFSAERLYPSEKGKSIKTLAEITAFKAKYIDWETKIDSDYGNKVYILKNGDLEHYLGITKTRENLTNIINFCNTKLTAYLADDTNNNSKEIREIIKQITL